MRLSVLVDQQALGITCLSLPSTRVTSTLPYSGLSVGVGDGTLVYVLTQQALS